MQRNKNICILGLMSGTSLDGLDLVMSEFSYIEGNWGYKIIAAKTIPYQNEWKENLMYFNQLQGMDLYIMDQRYGRLLGELANAFCSEIKLVPDLIASHGHTIFHRPELGCTVQIGNGAFISAVTGLPVISDFRTMDVAYEGQGAPLVPLGDVLLFPSYSFCLNLGGISNVSFERDGERVAFDICPLNQVLNYLSNQVGLEYDKSGLIARSGKCNKNILELLNGLGYYSLPFPKSLGREWVENNILPILKDSGIPIKDQLATFVEHSAWQIASILNNYGEKSDDEKVLATGGGAHNFFLIERVNFHLRKNISIVLPDDMTINFKEALIFAFLGLLRIKNIPNCLKSVTGAVEDSIGGALYGDFGKISHKTEEKYSKI